MNATHDQGTLQGYRLFPRQDAGTLTPLRPVFPTNSFELILKVLRKNVENALDRGDVKAVQGYASVFTGITSAVQTVYNAYETIDGLAEVLDATEKSLVERFKESLEETTSAP